MFKNGQESLYIKKILIKEVNKNYFTVINDYENMSFSDKNYYIYDKGYITYDSDDNVMYSLNYNKININNTVLLYNINDNYYELKMYNDNYELNYGYAVFLNCFKNNTHKKLKRKYNIDYSYFNVKRTNMTILYNTMNIDEKLIISLFVIQKSKNQTMDIYNCFYILDNNDINDIKNSEDKTNIGSSYDMLSNKLISKHPITFDSFEKIKEKEYIEFFNKHKQILTMLNTNFYDILYHKIRNDTYNFLNNIVYNENWMDCIAEIDDLKLYVDPIKPIKGKKNINMERLLFIKNDKLINYDSNDYNFEYLLKKYYDFIKYSYIKPGKIIYEDNDFILDNDNCVFKKFNNEILIANDKDNDIANNNYNIYCRLTKGE
jgi:hypothetical protein